MKLQRLKCLTIAALAGAWLVLPNSTHANDWNAGVGDWANAANWNGGVPNNSGGWAIGNVQNGGTAIISSAVPNVSELWAGNGGGAGMVVVTNGGAITVDNWLVVARMYQSTVATPLSTLIVNGGTVIKNGNWGDGQLEISDDNGGVTSTGQGFLGGTGLIQINGGAFRIGPGASQGTFTVSGQGHLRFTSGAPSWFGIGQDSGSALLYLRDEGWIEMGTCDFNVGDAGTGRGRAYISGGRVDLARFWIGKSDTSKGAIWQSGGIINGTGANANEWCIGGDNSGATNVYGFLDLSGGTFSCPFNFQLGRYGKGVLYQTGGTNTQSSWTAVGRMGNSIGVMWISGGRYVHTGVGTHTIIGEQGRGECTLSGSGTLDCAATLVVGHGYESFNGDGYLNLNGGTVVVPGFERWGGGTGHLNFNGGTVKPKVSNPNFLNGLTEAHIFAGNAIFDTDGYDITIGQSLLDVSGDGVTSIAVASGGAGYIGPPVVQISGDGYCATAAAQIDPAAGTVTNILVTCPGFYYSSAPTVTLIGGGATTDATVGEVKIGSVVSGGLVKNGAGTLTLNGANGYTGATVVNAGKVISSTDPYGSSRVTVADGAGFGVRVAAFGGTLYIPSIALATSGPATLDFDLGSYGNPLSAVLMVNGNLAVNGPITVNLADANPQIGQIPLMQYNSRSGSGSLVIGTLPEGVQGNLVDDTVNKLLYFNVTSIGQPRWEGLAGGNWDIGLTTNWIELSTGLPTAFKDGAPALFDDNALGTNTVNLVATVLPAGVTVTNLSLSYTIVGAGKISGSKGLTKSGGADLAVLNSTPNEYTGPTVIKGGTLSVTNLANGGSPSAIGKSSSAATNLVLAGGTLSYAGPATAIDRGYYVGAANSAIDLQSDLSLSGPVGAAVGSGFVKTGPATLAFAGGGTRELGSGAYPSFNIKNGTVAFDGSTGGQVNHVQGEVWVGGDPATPGSLVLSNTTLNVDSWFAVGRGNGSVGNVSTATLYNSALRCVNSSLGFSGGLSGNSQSPAMTLHGTSTFTNNGDMNLGESGGSSATITLKDTSIWHNNWRTHVGWNAGATGAVVIADSAAMYVNAWVSLGNEGGTGSLLMKDNSRLWVLWDLNVTDVGTGTATMDLQGNASVAAGAVFVAKGEASTGTASLTGNATINANSFYVANATNSVGVVNQNAGTVRTAGGAVEFQIGVRGTGTYNLSGGVVNSDGNWSSVGRYPSGTGILNISGGVFNHTDATKLVQVGEEGNGTLNLSGTGVFNAAGDRLQIASAAASTGVVNLDGGMLVARRIAPGGGSSAFHFNGGLLRAAANAQADFLSGLTTATVKAGGARIDTAANNISIAQALLDGTGGGGLTKTGTGTLALLGANTYTGPTLINEGALAGTGTIAGSVTVASGATLAPGLSVGTLTINGSLTLASGSVTYIELAKTNLTCDQVVGTTAVACNGTLVLKNLGGLLAAGDTFTLFPSGTRTGGFSTVTSITPGQTVTWDTSLLTVDGSVKVKTAEATPVALTPVVGGGSMTLTWPANQVGWILETQSNPLTIGLSTNWVVVPGSMFTNSVTVPVSVATPTVFYRLTFPQ